jgi:hypothetical protein
MSDPRRIEGHYAAARLAHARARPLNPLPRPVPATGGSSGSQAGGTGRVDRSARDDTWRDRGHKGGEEMRYRERFTRELRRVYEELMRTPPVVLLVLSCLAILLVGAILIGASRP